MNECLKVREHNCKHCYKCIRNCPVKAIRFISNQAGIVRDECVLCGRCFVCCPQSAWVVRDDIPTAKALLKGDAPVYASIAPSFAANYPGVSIKSITNTLLKMGFAGASETAIGATIVKKSYNEMLNSDKQQPLISSCCHTVNMLIQRYFPETLPYLAKVQSPMLAHCAAIKREHPGVKTVFFGPCISKKDESEQYPGIVDCVVTFEGLSKWLIDDKIELQKDDNPERGGKARLFPVAGGIIRSMLVDNNNFRYLVIDGMDRCMTALKEISEGKLTERCFIEMSACTGSCIGGPTMGRGKTFPIRGGLAVEKQAGKDDFSIKMPPSGLLQKSIKPQPVPTQEYNARDLEETLRRIGKSSLSDELNCGSCGYDTCREKALATLAGKSDETMCLPYLMERAQSFSDIIVSNSFSGVIVMNESLIIQEMNVAGGRILDIEDHKSVVGEHISAVLDPTPFLEISKENHNIDELKVCLAEQGRHISLSILYDFSFHVIIAIIRDITERETAREIKEARDNRTIEITDKVIEKQMATVQIIASLLGETTAETKIALTKLKETLRNE